MRGVCLKQDIPMFIMINDQVSVENLLKGIIIASGNDAVYFS